MNNSMLSMDSFTLQEDANPEIFKEREAKLTKVIETIREVRETKAWSSLKTELLDNLPASLEKQISVEAKKLNPDTLKLNRLAGELKWADRYSDLKKYEDELRVELANIRDKIYVHKQN